jgi:16S rRNA (guanine1207-N2)-methyltransferase
MGRPGYRAVPQYFDAQPAAASRPTEVELVLADLGRTLTLTTDRAVFSGARIDHGTSVLVRYGPPAPAGGVLLDLGCGYGPIALALAARDPSATVWAIDSNERAVGLCRDNAAAAGLENVRSCTPGDVPKGLGFDGVWSNPPIRVGQPALRSLLTAWLARLTPEGQAALVVQKHLGADSLAEWLGGQGWTVERLRSKQGYRILGVRR